jgi:hypothetical protein
MDPWERPAIEAGQYLRHRRSKARTAYFVVSSKQTKETAFVLKCQRLPIAEIPQDAEVRLFTWHPRVKKRKKRSMVATGPVINADKFEINKTQWDYLLKIRGGCQCHLAGFSSRGIQCSRCETPVSVSELEKIRDYFLAHIIQRGGRTPEPDEPMPDDYLSIERYLESRGDNVDLE